MILAVFATVTFGQGVSKEAVDRDLATWKPTKVDRIVPPEDYLVRNANFVGHWSNARSNGHVEIDRIPNQPSRFTIVISPDLHSWGKSTRSSGRVVDGILLLDRPIYEFVPIDRLYAIKYKGKVRLVSARGWQEIHLDLPDQDRVGFGIFTYGKRPVPL